MGGLQNYQMHTHAFLDGEIEAHRGLIKYRSRLNTTGSDSQGNGGATTPW